MASSELILTGIGISSWSQAQRDALMRLVHCEEGLCTVDFVPAVWNRRAKAERDLGRLRKAGHVVYDEGRWRLAKSTDRMESCALAVMGREFLGALAAGKQLALPKDAVAIAVVTSAPGPVQDKTLAEGSGSVVLSQSRSSDASAGSVSVPAEAAAVKEAFEQLREHLKGRAPPPVLKLSHRRGVPGGTVQGETSMSVGSVPSRTGREVESLREADKSLSSTGSGGPSRPGQDGGSLIDIEKSEAKSNRIESRVSLVDRDRLKQRLIGYLPKTEWNFQEYPVAAAKFWDGHWDAQGLYHMGWADYLRDYPEMLEAQLTKCRQDVKRGKPVIANVGSWLRKHMLTALAVNAKP
jgi:hypothetical protein